MFLVFLVLYLQILLIVHILNKLFALQYILLGKMIPAPLHDY